MATLRNRAATRVLWTCLFLVSIYDVDSAPEVARSSYQTSSSNHKSGKVVRRSLVDYKDLDEDKDSFSDSLNLGDQPISSYNGLHLIRHPENMINNMNKRDARLHVRSSSRLRTLLRIETPCAGGNEHYTIGAAPTAASVSITPRDLLVTLGNEAVHARKLALHILHRLEETGVDHSVALVLGQASNTGLHLRKLSGGEGYMVLNDIYKQLARAALFLEEMVEEGETGFTPLIQNLKENGIYSLLCGVKVVLDAKDPAYHQSSAAILGSDHLMEAPNRAFRLARNYNVIREVARLLDATGTRLTLMAQYL